MVDLSVAEQTLVGRVTGGHVDDLPFATVTEKLGLGKLVAVGFNGLPTWIDPAATDWADVVANNYGWLQLAYSPSGDKVFLSGGKGATPNNFQLYVDDDGVQFYAIETSGGQSGFLAESAPTGVALFAYGADGQTTPILDLQDNLNNPILQVAPNGSVGGVTPTTSAFVVGWDGSKWIAVSLAAVYEAFGTAILKTVVNAKGDLVSATADNTPSIVTAGADDTILMADSAATSGLKWVASATPSTQAIGDAASIGTADTFTRGDHKHAMPAFATNAVVLGTAAAAGSAVTLIRSDATIAAFDATSPTTQAVADAAAVGTAAFAARRDHKHAWPSGASFMASLTGTNGADFSMNSHKITALTDPTAAQDASTKNYTDAAAGGVAWTVVTKSGDESVSSSTALQADDHLLFTAASGGSYEIEVTLVYASPLSAGVPDLKVAFGEDNTIRGQMGGTVQNAGDTVATSITGTNQTTTIALGTSATKRVVVLRGSHQGAGGTFNVLWAQNTSDTNATTIYTGSLLRYRRIV